MQDLTREGIERALARLGAQDAHVEFHSAIDSTSTRARELAMSGAPHGSVVAAETQTAGRGRQGRAFCSPAGSGAYFTLLLRPGCALDAGLLSAACALSVCTSCEAAASPAGGGGTPCRVKWPNDVYCRDRKVAGILVEAVGAGAGDADGSRNDEAGGGGAGASGSGDSKAGARCAGGACYLVGIGINVYEPRDGWPAESPHAGSLLPRRYRPGAESPRLRGELVASACAGLLCACDAHALDADAPAEERARLLAAYRERSMLPGRMVEVERGHERFAARVLGVDEDFALRVRAADGRELSLASGEVHLRLERSLP